MWSVYSFLCMRLLIIGLLVLFIFSSSWFVCIVCVFSCSQCTERCVEKQILNIYFSFPFIKFVMVLLAVHMNDQFDTLNEFSACFCYALAHIYLVLCCNMFNKPAQIQNTVCIEIMPGFMHFGKNFRSAWINILLLVNKQHRHTSHVYYTYRFMKGMVLARLNWSAEKFYVSVRVTEIGYWFELIRTIR